jgi:hypothetical protein
MLHFVDLLHHLDFQDSLAFYLCFLFFRLHPKNLITKLRMRLLVNTGKTSSFLITLPTRVESQ